MFIIGSRGYHAKYGGWETFVSKLVDNYNDKDLLNEIIIKYALMLTTRMVPAAYSYSFNVAKKWGMTKKGFTNIAIEGGYKESSISFPKLPLKPSDLIDCSLRHLTVANAF